MLELVELGTLNRHGEDQGASRGYKSRVEPGMVACTSIPSTRDTEARVQG